MTKSAVGITNLALDELPHRHIVSLNDNVLAAEVALRQLPQVLGEIMESGEWSFGIRRIALSEITNDRSHEWSYAYASPLDVAMPLRISSIPTGDAEFLGPGQTLAPPARIPGEEVRFDFEGSTIWTNEPGAILDYITTSPEWTEMRYRFIRLLTLNYAARMAVPVKKDYDLKRSLLQEAELFGQRALASDLNANKTQHTYGDDFIPTALRGYFTAPE